ncbi:MAG: lipoate--protein ligase family protein [Gemmatimonadota bacterium]
MTRWRLLETGARPGDWNMACDAALLASAEASCSVPTLRFYGWNPPAVSLGHHQADPAPAEAARLRAREVDWVRRPTGGRAVYHGPPDEELTYSVVARLGEAGLGGGLADSHRRIHTAIAAALTRLGAPVELAPRRSARSYLDGATGAIRPTSRRACFAATVPWEIAAGGRKLVGSAQRRSRQALLQHGSIPLAGDQDLLAEIWPGSLEPGGTATVSSAVGRPVGFAELAASLAAAFAKSLGAELEPAPLTDEEQRGIDALLFVPALA